MFRFLQCCVYSLDWMIYFRAKSNNEKLRRMLSILLIPIGLLRYIYISIVGQFDKKVDRDVRCAVVLIMKDEARYIREFIEYYTNYGCDIIIYDNDSTDGSQEIVKEYSNVDYNVWTGVKRQMDAYNHACKKYRNSYDYLLFYDTDEFLVCDDILNGKSLTEILDEFFNGKKVADLCINWLMFGSSGYIDYPDGGVIDSFTRCAKYEFIRNRIVKSCVNPRKIVGWVDAHVPTAIWGYKKVNVDGKEIVEPMSPFAERKDIFLHHYFVKNRNYFIEKINKGRPDISEKRSTDEFNQNDTNDCINEKAKLIRDYLGR